MALARGRVPLDSYYENLRSGGSSSQALEYSSSLGFFGLMGHNKVAGEGGKHFESLVNYPAGHLPGISDPSSSSSGSGGGGGFVFGTTNSPSSAVDSHHSVLNFKSSAGCNYGSNTFLSSSMLSFDQGHHLMEDYGSFADAFQSNGQLSQLNLKYGADSRLASDRNCLETSSANGSARGTRKVDGRTGDEQFGWLYSEAETGDGLPEGELLEGALRIRPDMGGDVQPSKRHCSNKKAKDETISTKDPQSIAAKNRRERISERLKILQDLVPNGTKVDLVTMLEKAISYVKFLQLQVKVLATDEFWPSQGGKAPEIAQVKEAIDAILSSQRNPSSK